MELKESEIDKISKKFKVPKKDILDFLIEEERIERFLSLKRSFLENDSAIGRAEILKNWLKSCKSFHDYEEIYVILEPENIPAEFFENWLRLCRGYKEKRDVYLCLVGDEDLKKRFIKIWIEGADSLEDVREAISHATKDSDEHKAGIKKIIKKYNN